MQAFWQVSSFFQTLSETAGCDICSAPGSLVIVSRFLFGCENIFFWHLIQKHCSQLKTWKQPKLRFSFSFFLFLVYQDDRCGNLIMLICLVRIYFSLLWTSLLNAIKVLCLCLKDTQERTHQCRWTLLNDKKNNNNVRLFFSGWKYSLSDKPKKKDGLKFQKFNSVFMKNNFVFLWEQ